LGVYPTTNSKVKSQHSIDMHNSKTSVADDHREDSTSNGINEETSHSTSSIDMAEQQASCSVSANKIDGHLLDDIKEIDIAIKKNIFMTSDKLSRCVAEWVDANSMPFICSTLNPVVQNNRQKKIRYIFNVSNYDEIFDILVLEKKLEFLLIVSYHHLKHWENVHIANDMILFLIIFMIAMYFVNNCNQLLIKAG
jgi:hypothetical protein